MSERKQTQNTSPPPASHLGPARGCWAAMRMLSTGTWTPNSCPSVQIQWHFQNVSLLWGWRHKFQPGMYNQFGDTAWYGWVINTTREGKAWSSLLCNGFTGVGALHPSTQGLLLFLSCGSWGFCIWTIPVWQHIACSSEPQLQSLSKRCLSEGYFLSIINKEPSGAPGPRQGMVQEAVKGWQPLGIFLQQQFPSQESQNNGCCPPMCNLH